MQRTKGSTASWETYSGLAARGTLLVRADGRGFKKILQGCQKPYDLSFAQSMVGAIVRLFRESGSSPTLAFTFSDEVSLLFSDIPFSGRVEKLDSVISGFLSGALSLELGRVVSFDCRVIPICPGELGIYLEERQDETWRNHVFSYGFYSLICDGKSVGEAMNDLRGLKESEIHEMLFKRGINLARTPAWERRGVLIYKRDGELVSDWEIPLFTSKEGKSLIEEVLGSRNVDKNKIS
jgi:tRNA(His) guanylyltransferase